MLKTKCKLDRKSEDWDRMLKNGHFMTVRNFRGKEQFTVLLLGNADYVLITLNKDRMYDPRGEMKLLSINGEFRDWVENGMNGSVKGVRWTVEFRDYTQYGKPEDNHWEIGTESDMLAVEHMMGEIVNRSGKIIDVK